MIYTIGYQKLPFETFLDILRQAEIQIVVDVRSKPYGRAYLYNRKNLEKVLKEMGLIYWYKGDVLGGFNPVTSEGLKWLEGCAAVPGHRFGPDFEVPAVSLNFLLLCFEADPRECHRHQILACYLLTKGIEVIHLDHALNKIRAGQVQPQLTLL